MAYTYKRCGIVKVADTMSLVDQEALLLLIKSDVPATRVQATLKEFGYQVGYQIVIRHRRGECSCK